MKKRKMQTIGSNAIDSAASSQFWGKKRFKKYKNVAGKGGKTTNFEIPEWIFQRELEDMKEGVINA